MLNTKMVLQRKELIDPNEIYLPKVMNPRPLNQGFIESLRESMIDQGFLPDYPVKVFEGADQLLILEGNKLPYACVSGMHRTTAAQLAGIDRILCEVYSGESDDFVEMMMTDNFAYDPTKNSELGQVFSQKEKRKACSRLLYLPKYFQLTNSALVEQWHTHEGNIRRWRKEVIESLDAALSSLNEPHGCMPETLSRIGVTHHRVQMLKELSESSERKDAEGNTVAVRSKSRELTDEQKGEYWSKIREDAGWHDEGWLKKHGIEDWDYVRKFLSEKHGIEDTYKMGRELTTAQLRKLHNDILVEDPQLIASVQSIAEVYLKSRELNSQLIDTCREVKKWLISEFVQGNEWSQEYKDCAAAFEEAAHAFGWTDYKVHNYDFPTVHGKPETFKVAIDTVNIVRHDIRDEQTWIVAFRQQMEKKTEADRKKLVKNWNKARTALLEAFEAYPRDISLAAFCFALEDEFYEKQGMYQKLLTSRTDPSDRVHNETLREQTNYFKKAAKGLQEDAKWVKAIHEEPVTSAVTPIVDMSEFEGFDIGMLYFEVTHPDGKFLKPKGAKSGSYAYSPENGKREKIQRPFYFSDEAVACISDVVKAELFRICKEHDFEQTPNTFRIYGPPEEETDASDE